MNTDLESVYFVFSDKLKNILFIVSKIDKDYKK